jgi:excisionase
MSREKLSINDKVSITVLEAAELSSIGKDKIYQLMKEPDCDFVLQVGEKKCVIKREKFINYINSHERI